jgi:RNA polymerase sigma factor (sigma-70 family)
VEHPIDPALTTAAILQRLARGPDPEAWTVLVERHGAAVYQAAFRVTGEHALAEDATQETFLHIRGDAGRFRAHAGDADAAAQGWIMRIACTSALQLMRRRGRQRRHERHFALEHARTRMDEGQEPDTEERARLDEALRRELAELPESHRLPLLLHYCGGLDYQHIAEQVGCSSGNARVRVHRALERLRARLARAGFAAGTAALVGQLHASEGVSHLSPAMLAKCHALLASTQVPILSTSTVLGGTSLGLKLGVAAASLLVAGSLVVPLLRHHEPTPPPAAPVVQAAPVPSEPPPAPPSAEVVAPPGAATAALPHHTRGIVLRLLPGVHGLLLRDGERIEAYVMHHHAEGVPESPESIELARRIAALTNGSEVEITWEPVHMPKGGEGGGEGMHREADADGVHHDPAAQHAAEPGEHGTPGAARRWHRRLIVGLEVVVLAAPGQAPAGPAIKNDDLF